jgi:hypothetical protein
MLDTKKYFNQLDATLFVKELDNEKAAAIQGGYELQVYRDFGGNDLLGSFNYGKSKLSSDANNQISSVRINSGTWRFYNYPYYNKLGGYIDLGPNKPGEVWNLPGFNEKISSIKQISG